MYRGEGAVRATRHLTPAGEARRGRIIHLWTRLTPRRYLTAVGERHRQNSVAWLVGGLAVGILGIVVTATAQ